MTYTTLTLQIFTNISTFVGDRNTVGNYKRQKYNLENRHEILNRSICCTITDKIKQRNYDTNKHTVYVINEKHMNRKKAGMIWCHDFVPTV